MLIIRDILNKNTVLNDLITQLVKNFIKRNKFVFYDFEKYRNHISSVLEQFIYAYLDLNKIEIEKVNECDSEDCELDIKKMYLNEIFKIPLLNRDEEKELALKIADGDEEARKKLMIHNLRLVAEIVRRFILKNPKYGGYFLDLVQDGNLELMKAIEKFDPNKGNKFSTFATKCIKNHLMRITFESGMIRIPFNTEFLRIKVNFLMGKYQDVYETKELICKIAKELDISEDNIINLLNIPRVEQSLNEAIVDGDENSDELMDLVIEESSKVEDEAIESILKKIVWEALNNSKLKERQRKVLIERFGLSGSPKKLCDIAIELGITEQAVNQCEKKGLIKLRKNLSVQKLRDFIE